MTLSRQNRQEKFGVSRYFTFLTVFSANEERWEHFLLGLSTKKNIEIWIIGCAFDVAAPDCNIMPVTMREQIGIAFATQYNLGCKHHVRCLYSVTAECTANFFALAVTCYNNWYLYILNLKRFCTSFGTVDFLMLSCRALSC